MPEPEEFDAEKSKRERDKGMARALRASSTFADVAGAFIISKLPIGWEGTGEDIRRVYYRHHTLKPHHNNAWGGVINGAIRNGYLVKTGKRPHMKQTSSHARSTDRYVRV